ncbi:GGDEF domain-containing protein [Celeribacter neptunius]|uniref:Diguanylate cyclase (GGDEF) domain-containing protein n=1 Tax=Celeribacter neptunius TaxID=588602 RepID=A0A1I3ILB8_9RHOB|nr:GGDEF domain-containing protein [Celeribacter neptunius]SFI48774.1 diguanylate cyclase (GGDEF) domain-containing protein [Celeribacter neptunius]
MSSFEFDPSALIAFMPMSLVFDNAGVITFVGPTLAKLRPAQDMIGRPVTEVFTIRDNGRGSGDDPIPLGTKLYLNFQSGISTPLKGMAAAIPAAKVNILNLSFGISIVDAVANYRLTAGDFAHTDLAIEMLYLVEAKSAVLEETKQLNARLQGAKVAAEEQAFTDTLTGLKNRRAMDHVLARMLRSSVPFALMHLDLDYFKSVNDTLGHAAGDAVLQQVARILSEETRTDDMVARVGGDEFILIFNKIVEHDHLYHLAARIITRLEEPVPYEETECRISGSIGITTTDFYDHPDADRMIHDADLALYSSKYDGRGRATVFDPLVHDGNVGELPAVQVGR